MSIRNSRKQSNTVVKLFLLTVSFKYHDVFTVLGLVNHTSHAKAYTHRLP